MSQNVTVSHDEIEQSTKRSSGYLPVPRRRGKGLGGRSPRSHRNALLQVGLLASDRNGVEGRLEAREKSDV